MQFQRLAFTNRSGQKLAARLDLPVDETPVAYAILAHCFTCTKNLNAIVNISRALTREGIAVLRFDFTGLGESEGDFADTSFSSNVDDLVDAAGFLADHHASPKMLIGHSLGGAAVLQAASSTPSVVAVATIGAPADTSHLASLLADKKPEIEARGEAEVVLGGQVFRIKQQFLDDLERAHMEATIRELNRPLLIMHSPEDHVVPIENGERIFATARHPKSFISLDGTDHLMSNRKDSLYAGSVLGSWGRKYLGVQDRVARDSKPDERGVTVRTGDTGYRTEIVANGHRLMADEPIALGGSNTGPTPYDLLTASLGACTAITLRMYADRKEWPLRSINVHLQHQKMHITDCRECESESGTGKIDVMDRLLELHGPLNEEQRQRLVEIADRCPVHRSLHAGVTVRTRLKAANDDLKP